ncbi:MAG: hypothetical protein WCV67_03980 [Victivallaceae bacterium]|jgi:hypothetical protein
MKDACKNYIETILADNEEQRAAFRAHCGECPECAALASDWKRLRKARIPVEEVPLSLDFAVLAAAGNALRERLRRRRVALRRIIYYGAAAACVALACLVTIFPPADQARGHREIAKSWDWSKFDKELFETAAAIEISNHCISISGTPDAPAPNLPVIEEEPEQI